MTQYINDFYEFDLVVRKKGYKDKFDRYGNPQPWVSDEKEQKEPETLEELKFNTLDVREAIRKLIDYIKY